MLTRWREIFSLPLSIIISLVWEVLLRRGGRDASMKHQTNMENIIDFTVYFIQRSDNIHLFILVAESLIAALDS